MQVEINQSQIVDKPLVYLDGRETELRMCDNGEFFKRTQKAKKVWIRGDYVPSKKAFLCHAWDDVCQEMLIKADKKVFVDFYF
jgi:hypothetical protein